MKNYKLLLLLLAIIFTTFTGVGDEVFAATGRAYIHYFNESGASGNSYREKTYIDAKPHLTSIGYSVYGYNAQGVEQAAAHILTAKVFVVHNHGLPGVQMMDGGSQLQFIAGKGNETPYGTSGIPNKKGIIINNFNNNALSNMKIAIFYGCNTGVDGGTLRGNLPALMVAKGAKTAVAWKVTTYVNPVNEWNRLFFEKAKNDTVVEGYRHADYWLETIYGAKQSSIMADNRNEAGNIYTTIY